MRILAPPISQEPSSIGDGSMALTWLIGFAWNRTGHFEGMTLFSSASSCRVGVHRRWVTRTWWLTEESLSIWLSHQVTCMLCFSFLETGWDRLDVTFGNWLPILYKVLPCPRNSIFGYYFKGILTFWEMLSLVKKRSRGSFECWIHELSSREKEKWSHFLHL